MGKTALVDHRIDQARSLVDCLIGKYGLDISAAYWIEDLDDQEWTMHVVSSKFDEPSGESPYHAISLAIREHPEIDLEGYDIVPRPTNDRKVVEITNFLRDYPAAEAFRLGGVFLKGRWVERSYIFPIKLGDMVASAG